MSKPIAIIRRVEQRTAAAIRTASPLDEMRAMLHTDEQQVVVPWLESRAVEHRNAAGVVELAIEGYAAVWDSPTIIDYGSFAFEEILARGAFRKLLRTGADIVCQADHCGEPLGRISNGALTVEEDAQGVRYRCVMPATQHGRDTWELVQRGDYPGCSFTFFVADGGDTWDRSVPAPAGLSSDTAWGGRRIIREFAEIRDIGPVTWPAYEATSVCVSGDEEHDDAEAIGTTSRSATDGDDALQRRARAVAVLRRTRP